ncbi:MAG: valine--tRNA ligase [Verrucomicrobia bacterium]|nr:valine--tRNA ligase [Verrucomicrobiota bacterium]
MTEIPKAYEPQSVEDKWYDFWVKQGCFTADPARVSETRPAYSIVIPPPNVTGMLHMGHVLNNTIQDILSRKARMDGKEVLWLPGTDHAGIATQMQVEKALKKEERKTKYDLGREEFLKRVWQWKDKHGGIIINQLKKLGCSCDWTRERFTMDPEYSRCVQKVFVELYKKGLIYRGKRMVNWCPVSQTALSDEEVEMKPQKGFMYHFKVQVAEVVGQASSLSGGSSNSSAPLGRQDACPTTEIRLTDTWLTIATTRLETIPGDTAVAVNPKDPRYASLIGKHIIRPLPIQLPREQKLIPIIGDEHVDFEFGTGVLKVTPAHDKADFDIGQRHKLPIVDIMNADGTMNDLAGADLRGLERFKARKVAEEKLTELGALVEAKPYENNVGFSQRADVPIEPRLSEQWFLKYPSVEQARLCVVQPGSATVPVADFGVSPESSARAGIPVSETLTGAGGTPALPKMRFHPDRWAKVYDHWLTNIQDWCISRQLWWGHQIPVWRASETSAKDAASLSALVSLDFPPEDIKVIRLSDGKEFPEEKFRENYETIAGDKFDVVVCGNYDEEQGKLLESDDFKLARDPDVLDTWFSSWLWPFATMGWPENTETLKKFYPTTDLVTGPDIIFFWVARMIMAGYEYMGELPFKNVYFTGIIRDKQGRKMSKTLGNSPDPLVLISQYGADALRFGTMRSAPLGQDVLFDEKDVELGRNFCNKLWNACRFRQMMGEQLNQAAIQNSASAEAMVFVSEDELDYRFMSAEDKWILLRLDTAIREITGALAEYNFSAAVQTLYRFFWSEYCDWYLEFAKAILAGKHDGMKRSALAVMDFVLSHTLRLFHPFLPFITEELWHGMGFNQELPADQGGVTIMNARWPKPLGRDFMDNYGIDECYLERIETNQEFIGLGRNLRREFNIAANKKVRFVFKPARDMVPYVLDIYRILLNAEPFEVNPSFAPPKGTPCARHASLGELYLPLDGLVDVEAEKTRLMKKLAEEKAEISKVEQKLTNPSFVNKVPPEVLAEHRQRLADWQAKAAHTQSALDTLSQS